MSPIVYATPPGICPDCGGNRQSQKPRCNKCERALARAEAAERAAERAAEPPEPMRAWSPFRCRAHHLVVVTWKGTGCESCAQEARASADRRRRRKAAAERPQVAA